MNYKIFLIAGISMMLLTVNSWTTGCGSRGSSGTSSFNAGISVVGQGLSAGKNIVNNGAVNSNSNNGAGISASGCSAITGISRGATNINTGKNSALTTSGKNGNTVANSGVITAGAGAGGSGGLWTSGLNSGYTAGNIGGGGASGSFTTTVPIRTMATVPVTIPITTNVPVTTSYTTNSNNSSLPSGGYSTYSAPSSSSFNSYSSSPTVSYSTSPSVSYSTRLGTSNGFGSGGSGNVFYTSSSGSNGLSAGLDGCTLKYGGKWSNVHQK